MHKHILFFLSHQPNPRFVKQIKYLSKNNTVSVVYFFREYAKDLSEEYDRQVDLNKSLGSISNGNYLKRIMDYFKSYRNLKSILDQNNYDVLVVNNIDTLALFKVSLIFQKTKTKSIIEISDLRSHAYTNTLRSKVIQTIEKFMFKFVDKLIVTSPKFYDMYYCKLFSGEHFVLENKPLFDMIPKRLDKIKNDKIVIGIVGLLLQGEPYRTLFETVKDNDKFEIHIHGKGVFEDLVKEYADKYSNIQYFGEYNFFQESAKIYSTLDMLYMPYDTTNGSLNNKIALPNKLYEAMYFRVPIITSKETYLGDLVDEYAIGVTIKCCNQDAIIDSLEKIIQNKEELDGRFQELPENLYIANEDYIRLEEYIIDEK